MTTFPDRPAVTLPQFPEARFVPTRFSDEDYKAGYLSNFTDAELGDTIGLISCRLKAKSGYLAYGSHTSRNIAASWYHAALKEAGRRVAAQVIAEGV